MHPMFVAAGQRHGAHHALAPQQPGLCAAERALLVKQPRATAGPVERAQRGTAHLAGDGPKVPHRQRRHRACGAAAEVPDCVLVAAWRIWTGSSGCEQARKLVSAGTSVFGSMSSAWRNKLARRAGSHKHTLLLSHKFLGKLHPTATLQNALLPCTTAGVLPPCARPLIPLGAPKPTHLHALSFP